MLGTSKVQLWRSDWRNLFCSSKVGAWLSDRQSLTAKLERRFSQLQFQLLRAQYDTLSEEESQYLSLESEQDCWRRAVLFSQSGCAAVFALLVVPRVALDVIGEEVVSYGSESIGHLLFSGQDTAVRSAFCFAQLPTQHPYVAEAERYVVPSLPQVYARRSICHYKSAPIMVVDVFLPDLIHEIEQD